MTTPFDANSLDKDGKTALHRPQRIPLEIASSIL